METDKFKNDLMIGETSSVEFKRSGNEVEHDVFESCMTTDDPITKRVANVKIVSGGQTGVDRCALEAAIALDLDLGGWAPHGWIAEDGTIPAQYRERMQEHPSMGGMV